MCFFSIGILEEDRDDLDNESTVKAKYFYQSCMDMGEDEKFLLIKRRPETRQIRFQPRSWT